MLIGDYHNQWSRNQYRETSIVGNGMERVSLWMALHWSLSPIGQRSFFVQSGRSLCLISSWCLPLNDSATCCLNWEIHRFFTIFTRIFRRKFWPPAWGFNPSFLIPSFSDTARSFEMCLDLRHQSSGFGMFFKLDQVYQLASLRPLGAAARAARFFFVCQQIQLKMLWRNEGIVGYRRGTCRAHLMDLVAFGGVIGIHPDSLSFL